MLALLRRRDFALLWTGGLVSVAGDYVLHAALPFFVYEQTGSTIATAGMIAAELAPEVVLGTVAGVFVDRWDRTRVLVVANLLQAAVVALLLLVPLDGWLWVVFVVAAVQSAVAAFAVPAEGALIPSLVDNADLVAANALNALNNRLARLIGVPVGGVLLVAFGLHEVVLVDCATFVAAALLIVPLGARPARRENGAGVLSGAEETAGRPGAGRCGGGGHRWPSWWVRSGAPLAGLLPRPDCSEGRHQRARRPSEAGHNKPCLLFTIRVTILVLTDAGGRVRTCPAPTTSTPSPCASTSTGGCRRCSSPGRSRPVTTSSRNASPLTSG